MSEMEALRIDAHEIKQAEINRLALDIMNLIETYACHYYRYKSDENKVRAEEYKEEVAEKIDKWLKNLPWVVN